MPPESDDNAAKVATTKVAARCGKLFSALQDMGKSAGPKCGAVWRVSACLISNDVNYIYITEFDVN